MRRTNFKWDAEQPTRVEAAHTRKLSEERQQREVYRAVDERDGYRCRCCNARTDPNATSLLTRGHHHHIVYRSAGGETTTRNVVLICARCHDEVHLRRTLRIEGNADLYLTFFRTNAEGFEYVSKQEVGIGEAEKD